MRVRGPQVTELWQGVASGCRLFRGKNGVARLGLRKVSAVWSLEVVASQRLSMYYINGIFNP